MKSRTSAAIALLLGMALSCSYDLRDLAEKGDPDAQFEMGAACEEGMGELLQDYTVAVAWYTRAAKQGHARAQYRLGLLSADGLGTKRDPEKAARSF